jgi:hypothetical protein
MKTIYFSSCHSILFRIRSGLDRGREKHNTSFMCNDSPPPALQNCAFYEIVRKNIVQLDMGRDDDKVHAEYKHTPSICDTYCVSNAAMVG